VTSNYRARDYTGTIIDRLTIGENLLESTVAIKRTRIGVWPQAEAEMEITPIGNFGNYFSTQERHSSRYELLEILSLKPIKNIGTHNLKFGAGITRTHLDGLFQGRPVNVLDSENRLFRRIEFDGGNDYSRNDLELATFAQDHWLITPKLAFDLGLRAERQNITGTVRLAPRTGLAWTPFDNQKTVLRGGFGLFYDRVPLNVYSIDNYPEQVITTFGPEGIPIDGPRRYFNIIEQVDGRSTPFILGGDKAGNFAPYSATWTTGIEHEITKNLRLRLNYMSSNSFGLVVVTPKTIDGRDALVASGDGQSRYRQFEVMTKLSLSDSQSMFFSYVGSSARSNINEFNNYLGNFPYPIVRADQYTNAPADLPNRFLAWGTINLPWKVRVSPLIEWRNGLPYSVFDERQNYVGQPFSDDTRFPNFFSFDARFIRELEINRVVESLFKYKLKDRTSVRISVSIYNLTNHFNPTSIHNNIADPQFGLFFGQNKRRFRLDLDLIF
jgi:hypothetical protein